MFIVSYLFTLLIPSRLKYTEKLDESLNHKPKLTRSNSGEICCQRQINYAQKSRCHFTAWYYYDRPYFESEEVLEIAKHLFTNSGFDADQELDVEKFTTFWKLNPEIVDPIKGALRYELWSERYIITKESSSEESDISDRKTSPDTYYSKASVLNMTQAVFAAKSGSSNKIINSNVFNTNKSVYITEESESGPIELFTSAMSEVKKGFLMKVRGGCGDLIKRFYFLKNNILYYYGYVSHC